ncbi:MAG: serine/threonine protein kinase [Planctomycetaceae bacterium]|nr:serine/threonine protein kinase [Planctomycetaceae bacterium]
MHQPTDEEIFTTALTFQGVEEQDRYIALTCAEDCRQQERIGRLLASHRTLTKINKSFVLDRSEEVCNELITEEPIAIGEQIGPYRIMQLLGEGGMGLVYQAEQLAPIRRRVALKLLKPGMDSQRVLARFELERQALAGMDHPGITQILDAGLADSGRPYFVMELVKGVTITEYCRTHELSALDRIKLMIQVCSAIQHAHQRGIIHRDIKPSNILIASNENGPLPKIIDFGIAKMINDSMGYGNHFTMHGEMIGTPEYMSPEQALSSAEEVDTRTDVYSLGALLYELLTGDTPLSGHKSELGLSRLRQILRDSRIELPSQRVKRTRATIGLHMGRSVGDEGKLEKYLKGDVDCIIMKTLAVDPNDRYQSVSELKRDLERFVAGFPIEAAPPGVLYQLKKLVKRHLVIATVASVALATIAISSALAIVFGFVANARLREVLSIQSELKFERDRAIEAERKSRLLAQSYLVQAVFEQSIKRYCIEHWDQLLEVNPKLKTLSVPKDNEILHEDVQLTVIDSNLLAPDERSIGLGDFAWLSRILSDIAKKDVGHLLVSPSMVVTIGETVTTESSDSSPTEESGVIPAQPVPVDSTAVADFFPTNREPSYKFPLTAKKAYLQIFCEELRAIDSQLPVVADAEDGLGLCLLDMQRPDLALAHFEASLRCREDFPELHSQTLLTQLFIADCLNRQGKKAESKRIIAQVRAEITAHISSIEATTVKFLNETADAIK